LPEKSFLPGDRVRIAAVREIGSARLLNGLTAEIVGPHPLVQGWYKIRVDENNITPHADWSAPADRLERCEEPTRIAGLKSPAKLGKTVRHFP
jgi:hypothetical protein